MADGAKNPRPKAVARVKHLIPRDQVFRQMTRGGEFLWPAELRPEDYSGFRTLLPNGERPRGATDLPLEEVGNAVLHLLEHNLSAPRGELVRETARLFGFDRLGSNVADRMEQAIDALVARGSVAEDGEMVTLGTVS